MTIGLVIWAPDVSNGGRGTSVCAVKQAGAWEEGSGCRNPNPAARDGAMASELHSPSLASDDFEMARKLFYRFVWLVCWRGVSEKNSQILRRRTTAHIRIDFPSFVFIT
jgi:hypothetical protein